MFALTTVAVLTGSTASASVAAVGQGAGEARPARHTAHLQLGPDHLEETRTTTTLQRGVTLTRITRGAADPSLVWTLESLIPSKESSPDPDAPPRVLSDQASAEAQADRLRAKGFGARVEAVRQPAVADVPAGTLGYRVRVGTYPTKGAADRAKAELAAAGETANSVYTGWDGDPQARGPWHVNVVRIDPRRFTGAIGASFGPDLHNRETTSALSRVHGATVGINGGFFVLDPAAGAPGDPAGAGVYDGRLLSEPTNDRPALILRDSARGTAVRRLTWRGHVRLDDENLRLDGVDRVPGLIRNCGGDDTDQPTSRPAHDTTCTDDSELVAFTRQYATRTPAGPGREIVLDAHHVVRSVSPSRGTTLAARWTSVQGTGTSADELADVRVGDKVPVTTGLVGTREGRQRLSPATTIINGGPLLVRNGQEHITQKRDGFVHADDPSFAYGWVLKRNPRTFAGVDGRGRTVLVTVDGRSTDDLGLTVPEAADVARSLGLVDAINLDGGGSTTMAVRGKVISHPSDSTGERPVGDALLVLPSRGDATG
jgi:hypothetical protein